MAALARTALDDPPVCGITTTRTGRFTNALTRFAPRRFVDWVILGQLRMIGIGLARNRLREIADV